MSVRALGSVLALTDFTEASFDREAFRAMKGEAVFDKGYVRETAWVGAGNFPHEYSNSLTSFSGREFPAFKTRDEALAWLAAD